MSLANLFVPNEYNLFANTMTTANYIAEPNIKANSIMEFTHGNGVNINSNLNINQTTNVNNNILFNNVSLDNTQTDFMMITGSNGLAYRTGPEGDLVGTFDPQILSNKQLIDPIISRIQNVGFLTVPSNTTDTLVARNTTDTLTNKTLTSPVISQISNTGNLTLPNSTDTLVGRNTTDTLTNKTLTTPVLTNPSFGQIINGGTLTLPTSTDTLVGRNTTDTLINKIMNGGNNTFSNIPVNAVIATSPNWPIISNNINVLQAIPYLNANQGGTGIDSSTTTGVPLLLTTGTWSINGSVPPVLGGTGLATNTSIGLPYVSSGTWSVNTSQNVTMSSLNVDTIYGKTNPGILSFFGSNLVQYYGNSTGVVGPGANVNLITIPTTSNTCYYAEFNTVIICTASTNSPTNLGKTKQQTTGSRYKNISGTLTLSQLYYFSYNSTDASWTGGNLNYQNIQADGTVPTSVDFQFYFLSGDTYSISWTITLFST